MAASTSVLSDARLSTQMNTRIERAVKTRGDAVLERHGVTPSQAVRNLWDYLVANDDIPEFMKAQQRSAEEDESERYRRLVQRGAGMATRLAQEQGLLAGPVDSGGEAGAFPAWQAMEDAMYEEMLDDYHALYAEP